MEREHELIASRGDHSVSDLHLPYDSVIHPVQEGIPLAWRLQMIVPHYELDLPSRWIMLGMHSRIRLTNSEGERTRQ